MKDITFITGNQHKANFLAQWLGVDLKHQKLELEELQTFDLHKIVEHKVRHAYELVQAPVLVEDVALTFHALGGLPGPFIKWFLESLTLQQLCDLVPLYTNRSALSTICYGLYDGTTITFFDGQLAGTISYSPRGNGGFGYDAIFIPDGSDHTFAEMNDTEVEKFSMRTTTVFPLLREYLNT